MKRRQLDDILAGLAESPSLVGDDRICLGYTAGGRIPNVDGGFGCELRWMGSAVPWWLAPLRLVAAANRSLFEISSDALPTFVSATDHCFTVEVYSCPRSLLPVVVQHLQHANFMASPGEVIDQDPAYFELEINCDGGRHDRWSVYARSGLNCPRDLALIARAVEDDDELDGD